MIALFLVLLAAAVVGGCLFAWFYSLERQGKAATTTLAVLTLLLVECVVWPNWTTVPAGPFHPAIGGQSFRLYEILIPMLLLARWLARPARSRISVVGLWWVAFLTWYAFAFVAGILGHHDWVELTFEAKTIIYIGGGAILVATTPAADLAAGIRRLARWFGPIAAVLAVTAAVNVTINLNIPMVGLNGFGEVGSDPASVFATLGILALCIEMVTPGRRDWRALFIAPLLVVVLMTDQRAVLLEVSVAFLIIALFMVTRTGRRRLTVTPTDMGILGLVVAALIILPMMWTAAVQQRPATLPFASEVSRQFTTTAKKQSATERINQWEASRASIVDHPFFGTGLATQVTYYDLGTRKNVVTPITHNIAVDLLLRTGFVGFLLFLIAVLATIASGLRAWLLSFNAMVAGMGLGAVAALAGLLTKGLVESIFEKPRLSVLIGLLVGLALSAGDEVIRDRHRRHLAAAAHLRALDELRPIDDEVVDDRSGELLGVGRFSLKP